MKHYETLVYLIHSDSTYVIIVRVVGVSVSEREVRPRHKPRFFSSSRNEESFAKTCRLKCFHRLTLAETALAEKNIQKNQGKEESLSSPVEVSVNEHGRKAEKDIEGAS